MKIVQLIAWTLAIAPSASPPIRAATAPAPPTGLVSRAGDGTAILHWDRSADSGISGYNIFRSKPGEPPQKLNPAPLKSSGFADVAAENGAVLSYRIRAVNSAGEESPDSEQIQVTPRPFANDAEFLEYLQHAAFDFFWHEVNPDNGLIRDRNTPRSFSSIAAVGFGLTAIGIGIDHGWITRNQGAARTLTTLKTFANGPQGSGAAGVIGYKGWFYHFLEMDKATRHRKCELSSIDTALLLAGVIYAREYFSSTNDLENAIRNEAEKILSRVDWQWMANSGEGLSFGWHPESEFIANRWTGYNEASILYILGLGAARPLPARDWDFWVRGYKWNTHYGKSFVEFPPLFGHQYSQCWLALRQVADPYLNARGLTYFENSRRATLAQRTYAMANPKKFPGYGPNVWGLTACDGPGKGGIEGYYARGAPEGYDDGTIAPTAAGGSVPFAPEVCIPALRFFYDHYRTRLWCEYGFRDAFNLKADWFDPDVLGIDQGPILIMIENFRSERVWKIFMKAPEVQRGLQRAGFVSAGK